ncbi:MAG: HEAT repeat domain-containing protein [Acidobacteria bacterium]|nr:HEAT repeat domain-containing protein [Acidobacteriota bacterium]
MSQVKVPAVQPPAEDNTWWYVTLFVLAVGLVGAVIWMLKTRKAEKQARTDKKEKIMSEDNAWDANSVDADKELEWYRRHKKAVGKSSPKTKKKNLADELPKTSKIFNKSAAAEEPGLRYSDKEFKEKLQTLHFNQLPIFKFQKIEMARPFANLSISNDEALMSAIEQTHDEYEEDEEVRDLAVRILTRFRTRNSVEALSQVALYDISSNLRSKAVSILADFDHESVFETILLCCADPTREVRAAAARGLFRLSFDRADAWSRIAETNDEFRMRQAALAAMEADLVTRSFDRLTHQDRKIAYEAVALLALMIRAGETKQIFQSIQTHNDSNVKLALLHVIGLTKDENTLPELYEILEKNTISKELKDKIDEVIKRFDMIPA